MTELTAIKPHLERRFNDQRVVFWHDPEGQYASDVDFLDLPGVTVLRVANDEYAIKHRLLHEQPNDRILVYRSGQVPAGIGNWLVDLELPSATPLLPAPTQPDPVSPGNGGSSTGTPSRPHHAAR